MPGKTASDIRIHIMRDTDIVLACHKGRLLAAQLGLSDHEQVIVVIAISEIAHNIVKYAQQGEIVLSAARQNGKCGITVVARDEGPGIPDIERALQDGYSTGGSLGLGLPGAKRLMDEFEVVSQVGQGTTVIMKKWRR